MPRYAAETTVSAAKSRIEIEETLAKYGADSFAYATTDGQAMIAFRMAGRQARIMLPLPRLEDFKLTETGKPRSRANQQAAWEPARLLSTGLTGLSRFADGRRPADGSMNMRIKQE